MAYDFLKPGYFIQLRDPDEGTKKFYSVVQSEFARYVWRWQDSSGADVAVIGGQESGPYNIENLKPLSLEHLFEIVVGIKGPAYVYLNLPLETRLWGTSKVPIATTANRRVGYISQEDSPWEDPSYNGLFYLMKGGSFEYPSFTVYNPINKTICPELKFDLAKCGIAAVTEPETLDKLYKKLIPYRPVSFGGLAPVRTGPG